MSRFEPRTFHLPLFNGTLHFALYKIASSFFNVPSECSRWKFLRMHLNRNAWMFWIFSRKSFTRKFIWEFDSKWFNFWCAFCHNFFGIFTCIVFEKLLIFFKLQVRKTFPIWQSDWHGGTGMSYGSVPERSSFTQAGDRTEHKNKSR